jgi:hypothetical protein
MKGKKKGPFQIKIIIRPNYFIKIQIPLCQNV